MSTQTLAEAGKLINDEIVAGVAETIVTTNKMFNFIPWMGFDGQSVTVNFEDSLGDSQHLAVGGTITAKAPSSFDPVTFFPTTTIGDVEMNGLVQATSSSAGTDQKAIEIMKKSKSVGRKLQNGLATGDGNLPNLNSLHTLCDPSQYTAASAGQALSFKLLDELIDLVKAKDGQVDYIVMHGKVLRAYRDLCRTAFNGNTQTVARELANGQTINIDAYLDIPIFQNDWLSTTETANGAALTGGALTSVYAGTFDDGDRSSGFAMIYPNGTPVGIQVEEVGVAETKDETITRIKSYSNAALFNKLGLARLPSIDLSA